MKHRAFKVLGKLGKCKAVKINLISIVIPVYNEEENIREICFSLNRALTSSGIRHEIIFVDDGSTDKTYDILRQVQRGANKIIKVIQLSKNFGQPYALLAGFSMAEGEVIVTMDGDLQNNPADIPLLLEKINEGADLVSGWRYKRKDPFIRKLISGLENRIISIRTGNKLHDYGCALTAIRKDLADKIKAYGKGGRFIKPLLVSLAESPSEVKVSHSYRKSGKSKYSVTAIVKFGIDFCFNFSMKAKKPLRLPYEIKEISEN